MIKQAGWSFFTTSLMLDDSQLPVANRFTSRADSQPGLTAPSADDYRTLVNSFAQAVWETDAGGRAIVDSPAWRAYTGQTLDEWLAEGWVGAVHPDEQALARQQWQEGVRQITAVNGEFRLHSPDGGWRWTNVRVIPMRQPDGSVSRWLGMNIDLSDSKKTFATLRESNEQVRLAAETNTFRITLTDALRPLASPIAIQARAVQILGRHLGASRVHYGEVDADGIHLTVLQEYTDNVASLTGRFNMNDYGQDLLARLRAGQILVMPDLASSAELGKDAIATYAHIGIAAQVGVPLVKGGNLSAVLSVHQSHPRAWTSEEVALIDETAERTWAAVERARTEEALRLSDERLRIVMESITDHAVITTDTQSIITVWNPGAQQLFGYTPEEAMNQSIALIFTPEDREAGIPEQEAKTAREQGRAADERYHQRKDGSRLYVSGVQSPLFNAMGVLLGYVKVARDLTQRQQTEQGLRDADQRKDEFLAMLAHELRNPLAPIANILQVLTLQSQENKTILPAVNMMSRQVEHLVRLIDDLLDVSRISRGKVELRLERIELTAVIRQALEAASPTYRAQGRQLNVTLPSTPIYLMGDVTRLTQVVSNLLTNGARYTQPKGQVRLSVEEVDGQAILRVIDNGIGLAKDQLTLIFDLFMQVDTALDRSQGGLGLGLTLVKKLVEMHGGQVEARSEGLGEGSEFIVSLPTLTQSEKAMQNNTKNKPPQLSGHRILVVDDNRDAADTLTMLLKLKKHEVHTRYGGREAIDAAESLAPDVVLLDISMPDLDGYETCRLIRQQPWGSELVLIALTGYGQEEDRQRSKEAGFDGHLVKPIDLARLTEMLTSLLPSQPGN